MAPALALHDLTFTWGKQPVLAGVNLHVHRGEFVSLVGPSGAGKSTLFKLVAGLLEPSAGRIELGGGAAVGDAGGALADPSTLPVPGRRGRTGYMPQRDCLLPWRTAAENAALLLELRGVRPGPARERARALLEQFGLGEHMHKLPHALSGGMRQRVAFARTLLAGADLLLLDEPFGALDALTRAEMQGWLLGIWASLNKTALFITHDVEEAVLLSDRVYVLAPAAAGQPFPVTALPPVDIDLGRPRRYELVTGPRCAALRRQLLGLLLDPAPVGGGPT